MRAVSSTPVAAPSDPDLATRLRLVVFRLRRRLHREASGDLTPSQASALSSVARLGPLTLGELSQVENVRPPTLTKVIAALEQMGLVVRHIDPNDRRVSRVEASKEGSQLLIRNRVLTDAYLAARLASLSAADQAALVRAVDVLERLLEGDE
ncbi:MAG: MarR family transcriptional regulator [Acidimicrobiales bacterium]